MKDSGDYTIVKVAELFNVSRPMVYPDAGAHPKHDDRCAHHLIGRHHSSSRAARHPG